MRTSTLFLLSVLPLISSAQWTTPDQNTAVRVGPTATPLSAPGPDGSTYVVWFDNTGGYELRMQRLDVDGNRLWQTEGLLVSGEPQNSALFRYDFKSDHAGNAIVAFQDERTGTLDIVAYKVSPSGEMLWGEGLELPTPESTGLAPVIGVLEDDRTVIAWNTDRSPSTVAYQVIPATGVPTLGAPTEITAAATLGRPRVVPCADGGFWMQWVQQSGNFLSPGTLMAERYDAAGAAVPGTNGAVSTKTISGFYFPEPIPDGHNGFYVAFNTGNDANESLTNIHVQRKRADGSVWSAAGTPVETGTGTQRYTQSATPALIDDQAGLMLGYSRTNIGQSEGGIAVQRLDTAGNRQLGPEGVLVVASTPELPSPFANRSTGNGLLNTWTIGGFNAQTMLAMQLDLSGEPTGPNPLSSISTVSSGKDDATLTPIRDGQAVAVWQDERAAGGVYAQRVLVDGANSIGEHHPQLFQVITTAHGDAELLVLETVPAHTRLRISDAAGRTAIDRRTGAVPSGGRIAARADQLAPGAYVIELITSDRRSVVRWVKP
ncbi:MAG TPA: hypothetical protein VGE21_15140 [Flavobacteriales bacterium]